MDGIKELVERCSGFLKTGHFPQEGKPESLTRQYLIEPLFRLLGWSEQPSQQFHYVTEFSGGMSRKWEDIVLMQGDMPMVFAETKALFDEKLLTERSVNELLGYIKEYNRKNKSRYRVDWGVLTNFREIHVFYVSETEPFCSISYEGYAKEASSFEQLLSVEGIKRHGIDLFFSEKNKETLGDLFLEDLKKWRLILANGFLEFNPALTKEQLRETSQQVLDRLIFIRALETMGILTPNWLGNVFAQWQQGKNYLNKTFSEVIREQFSAIESLYDTELFQHKLCDDLAINDDYLEETLKIQGPTKESVYKTIGFAGQASLDDRGIYGYNFNTLTFDIMGAAYERYLAHEISVKDQRAVIEETKELRRKEGAYYTPAYVVQHSIETTVGSILKRVLEEANKLLSEHRFKEARQKIGELSSLSILDPACGSGSFLTKAFDAIAECYSEYNSLVDQATQEIFKQKGLGAIGKADFREAKVTDIGERILLENLYGVDFDPQAVEVAKLNLWMKMLSVNPEVYRPTVGKKQRKLLPSLITRIKCGNSLFPSVVLISNVDKKFPAHDLAKLMELRRKLIETTLELSPAYSLGKTNQEIDNLRQSFELTSEEELKLKTSLSLTIGAPYISEESQTTNHGVSSQGFQGHPFVWHLEFPEVFLDKSGKEKHHPGFDLVIGNPPHGADLGPMEREAVEDTYELGRGYKNTAFLFIEQSYRILAHGGKLSFVIPKSLTFSQEWEKVRKFLLQQARLMEIADISKAFKGVLLEQVVVTLGKDPPGESFAGCHLDEDGFSSKTTISLTLCKETASFPIHADSKSLSIYHKIRGKSAGLNFGTATQTCRGFPLQARVTTKKNDGTEPMLRGDDLRPFMILPPTSFLEKNELEENDEKVKLLRNTKILSQNIVAHIMNPRDHIIIMAVVDEKGLLNLDTVMNTVVIDKQLPIHYLCGIMNSKLTSWFTYIFTYNRAVRTMHFDEYYINKIPVLPLTKGLAEAFASASVRLHKLVPQLASIDVDFRRYLADYPRKRDGTLEEYYTSLLHVEKRVMIDPSLTAKVVDVFARTEDEWLTLLASYQQNDKVVENVEIFGVRVADPELREFLCSSVNWGEKHKMIGNVLRVVLKTPIPRFDDNVDKNQEVIRKIIREYVTALASYRRIASEIAELERQLNETIYDSYGLDSEEISLIEDMFGRDSIVLSLFTQPRVQG